MTGGQREAPGVTGPQPAEPPGEAIPDWRADLAAAAPNLFAPAPGEDRPSARPPAPPAGGGSAAVADWVAARTGGRPYDLGAALDDGEVALTGLDTPAEPPDTVLVTGVLDLADDPDAVLAHAGRLLGDDGRAVVTVPLGPSDHPRERRAFYPPSLLALVAGHLVPRELALLDGYLCLVAEAGPRADATGEAERLLLEVQPDLQAALHDAQRLRAVAEGLRADIDGLWARCEHLQARAETAEGKLDRFRAERQTLRERVAQRDERISQARAREDRLRARAGAYRDRIAALEEERDQLAYALEKERWRLASMQARKWWRLGQLLRSVRTPADVARLPARLFAVLLRPHPRPEPPEAPTDRARR